MQSMDLGSRRDFVTFLASSFACAGVLGACRPAATSQPSQAPRPAAGAPVVALLRAGSGEEDFFNRALELFESRTPGVKVNRIFVPGGQEYITKLDLLIASGDPPAIYAPFSDRGYRYYAAKGLSQELDSFVARDKLNLQDFHQDGLKGCRWKGQLMALPLDLWPHLVFYNRSIFQEAGVGDLPTDWNDRDWTTEKYEELAARLTKRQGDQTVQFGSDVYFRGWPAGWVYGGDWFPPNTYETGICAEFVGDKDPRVAAGVQWTADLIVKHHYAPTPAEAQQVQAGAPVLFMSGKIGMGVTNIGRLSRYARIRDFAWGVGVMPRPPKGEPRRHHVWIDFWSMIKGTKNLEGSWQLLKFMVSPEAQKIYPIEYGPMSSLLSLGQYWADLHKKNLPNLSAKEFQAIIDAPKFQVIDPENWTVNFSQINSEALQPELDKVYLGQTTAEQAIRNMAPKVRRIIDETKNV